MAEKAENRKKELAAREQKEAAEQLIRKEAEKKQKVLDLQSEKRRRAEDAQSKREEQKLKHDEEEHQMKMKREQQKLDQDARSTDEQLDFQRRQNQLGMQVGRDQHQMSLLQQQQNLQSGRDQHQLGMQIGQDQRQTSLLQQQQNLQIQGSQNQMGLQQQDQQLQIQGSQHQASLEQQQLNMQIQGSQHQMGLRQQDQHLQIQGSEHDLTRQHLQQEMQIREQQNRRELQEPIYRIESAVNSMLSTWWSNFERSGFTVGQELSERLQGYRDAISALGHGPRQIEGTPSNVQQPLQIAGGSSSREQPVPQPSTTMTPIHETALGLATMLRDRLTGRAQDHLTMAIQDLRNAQRTGQPTEALQAQTEYLQLWMRALNNMYASHIQWINSHIGSRQFGPSDIPTLIDQVHEAEDRLQHRLRLFEVRLELFREGYIHGLRAGDTQAGEFLIRMELPVQGIPGSGPSWEALLRMVDPMASPEERQVMQTSLAKLQEIQDFNPIWDR